ncbi:MAG: CDP-glycerol glycerophosphotransferase family protein [Kiloniellales bacterium]|nr:CDP-glycerol glycerophosphotransferase family protein [Kiloniellales bacterium]
MNRKVASVPGSSMTNDVGSIAAPIEGADLPALRRLAGARFGAGDLAGALALLDKALKLAPADLESHVLAARYLRWAERFGPAMAHARTALEVAPDHGEALWLLGSTARMAGDAETAVAALERAAAVLPESAPVQHDRALALLDRGRTEAARAALERCLTLKPNHVWARATAMSLEAERDAEARLAGKPGVRRVALHINQAFHFGILAPVFEALRARHFVRITGAGDWVERFRPQVVVVSDAQAATLRKRMPAALFVTTRHGLIEKNHFVPAVGTCEYICVSSPAIRERTVELGGIAAERLWVTGYAQMDPLFAPEPLPLPDKLPLDGKLVLYAPTYNPRLSSAAMLGDRLVSSIRGERRDVTIVIKPHPLTAARDRRQMALWHDLVRREPGLFLVSDSGADIMPYLKNADLLISDVSSVAYAYLAMDRPIILLSHPERARDPHYHPDGLEWQWRDLGEELSDVADLPDAVARALDAPGRHAEKRARYRTLLFGDLTDGKAAERIAARIDELDLSVRPAL